MPDGIDTFLFGLGARYQVRSDCQARSRVRGAQAGFYNRSIPDTPPPGQTKMYQEVYDIAQKINFYCKKNLKFVSSFC